MSITAVNCRGPSRAADYAASAPKRTLRRKERASLAAVYDHDPEDVAALGWEEFAARQ
jgi:hypothetical protein